MMKYIWTNDIIMLSRSEFYAKLEVDHGDENECYFVHFPGQQLHG